MLQGFDTVLTPRQQAHLYASGALTIIILGTLALFALCLVALWAVVELAALLLQSALECLTTVGATYASADPLVKFLILVGIGAVLFYLARRFLRRDVR